MKSIFIDSGLFIVELFLLWVFYNSTLLVPGNFDLERILFIAVAGGLSFLCAYAGGRRFALRRLIDKSSKWGILLSPQIVVWVFVVAIVGMSVLRIILVYKAG